MSEHNGEIFALDIGTRTLVGTVLEETEEGYRVRESEVIPHQQRTMFDGQIHDISQVTSELERLVEKVENSLGREIESAAVAAAGRSLETAACTREIEYSAKRKLTEADVSSLEYSAVEKAREKLRENGDKSEAEMEYHFVGYTVKEYRVDGIFVTELLHQQASRAEVDIIATFLPRIVVDSLLSVIDNLDLDISALTLEPIAAAEAVVPRNMYNFNLALVDIGAGTADIAITEGGAMKAYGMVPVAGDEVTEAIADEFLLDYHSAEEIKCQLEEGESFQVKDALGNNIEVDCEKIKEIAEQRAEEMALMIGEEIARLNSGTPRAVICIGGGSLTPGFTQTLADYLDLDSSRVGIRGADDLESVEGEIEGLAGAQMITPLGIGVYAARRREASVFSRVRVNDEEVTLFSIQQPRVEDALLQASVDLDSISPRPGHGLTYTLNGELQSIPGEMGSPGRIELNGEEVDMEAEVSADDEIEFVPGERGQDAAARVDEVLADNPDKKVEVILDGEKKELEPVLKIDGRPAGPEEMLEDGAEIEFRPLKTAADALEMLPEVPEQKFGSKTLEITVNGRELILPKDELLVCKNGSPVGRQAELEDGDRLKIDSSGPIETIKDLAENNFLPGDSLEVSLNGKELEIPPLPETISVNGTEVSDDYQLESGDEVEISFRGMTAGGLLEYINYGLSDRMKKEASVYIDGEKSSFSAELSEGDEITLKF